VERVYFSSHESSIGTINFASTERGLCRVLLPGESPSEMLAWLDRYIRPYEFLLGPEFNREAAAQLAAYFAGQRRAFDLTLDLRGTPFQKRVWEELAKIPYGETRSYQDIAIRVGNAKACRAVGMANHANPLPIIIPCHRVIGKHGSLIGYGGGLDLKSKLLRLEGARWL
jgi:O-6-methylguanine DNA methyltransferase